MSARTVQCLEKRRLLDETEKPGESVSTVARRYRLSPSMLFAWREAMEGRCGDGLARRRASRAGVRGEAAQGADSGAGAHAGAQDQENEILQDEENEILKQAVEIIREKTGLARTLADEGKFPVKAIVLAFGVPRSDLLERRNERQKTPEALTELEAGVPGSKTAAPTMAPNQKKRPRTDCCWPAFASSLGSVPATATGA